MGSAKDRAVLFGYRSAASVARRLPDAVADSLPRLAAAPVAVIARDKRRQLRRHLDRVAGRPLSENDSRAASRRGFESYVRYYVESFRLPGVEPDELAAGIVTDGTDALWDALDNGTGAILALPHLGGWEWAGFWLTEVRGYEVTVVVEALEPPEVFDFFADLRRRFGMHIVALGPSAGSAVLTALKNNHIVCLLADRDLQGGGVEVDFFGETTTLPGGPALLGLRSGAPVFPTAVYFDDEVGHFGLVRPPLDTERRGGLRTDVARVTQDLAREFELLIRRAPDQWHLLQPNWPSDASGPTGE